MATVEALDVRPEDIEQRRGHKLKYQEIYDALRQVPLGRVVTVRLTEELPHYRIEQAVRCWARNKRRHCWIRFPKVPDRRMPRSTFHVLFRPRLES